MKIDLKLPDQVFGIDTGLIKIFIPFFVLIILFFISLSLVIVPKINEIQDLSQKINSQNGQIKLVSEKINYLTALDKNELNKNANFLNSALLQGNNAYFLVGLIKNVAEKYGFQIQSFSVSPGEINKDQKVSVTKPVKLPLELTVVGQKEKYIDFLVALENSLPVLVLDKFELKTSGNLLAELDLTISSYFVQDQAMANIANLSLADLTLRKDESDVLKRISSFQKIETTNIPEGGQSKFTKYEHPNPFSL